MDFVEWAGIVFLGLLVLVATLFVRRAVIARRPGTIEVSFRLTSMVDGRGWSSGLGLFAGDELRWYRVFSLSLRPRRVLTRYGFVVSSRRTPDDTERHSLPPGWVIVCCIDLDMPVEIAMAESTLTGFLSWIESAPPGSPSTRLAPG